MRAWNLSLRIVKCATYQVGHGGCWISKKNSNIQTVCFRCRGTPAGEDSNPRSWSDTYCPPNYFYASVVK